MLRFYELVFVMDAQVEQSKIDEFTNNIQKMITDSGGNIREVNYWGKRRLSYPINKKQYGFYVYILFEADGKVIEPIERECRLNESILRFLTVRLSKRAIRQMRLGKPGAIKGATTEEAAEVSKVETVADSESQMVK